MGIFNLVEGKQSLVTMSTLGKNGRFGNQIFQYAFLKIYAKKYNLKVEIPSDWLGHYLFQVKDPDISTSLVSVNYPEDKYFEKYLLDYTNSLEPLRDVDIKGFFQFNTTFYKAYLEDFRFLFKPPDSIEKKLKPELDRIRAQCNTLVGLHLRRGDYGYEHFFVAPNSWYLDWLESIWPTLNKPNLFIASDDPDKVKSCFRQYNPIVCEDLELKLPGADFYPDFYLLAHCDMLGISNSSFSFAASMLNECCRIFLRPSLAEEKLIEFDPWNSDPLLLEQKVENNKNLEIQLLQVQTQLEWKDKNLKKYESDIGFYKVKLQDTQAQLQDIQMQHQDTQVKFRDTQVQLEDTQVQLEDTQVQLQDTQVQLQQILTQLEIIKTSNFWRVYSLWLKLTKKIKKYLLTIQHFS